MFLLKRNYCVIFAILGGFHMGSALIPEFTEKRFKSGSKSPFIKIKIFISTGARLKASFYIAMMLLPFPISNGQENGGIMTNTKVALLPLQYTYTYQRLSGAGIVNVCLRSCRFCDGDGLLRRKNNFRPPKALFFPWTYRCACVRVWGTFFFHAQS